jgi:uncharacterized membrane protein
MRTTIMTVHIVTAAAGLLSGFIALYAAKGAKLHRASGRVFVYSMITMAMLGAAIAAVFGPGAAINVPVGLLTTYLVITGLITVAPTAGGSRRLDVSLLLIALAMTVSMFSLAFYQLGHGKSGEFVAPMFIFATIGLLGGAGDIRVLRSGPRIAGSRLRRHLWRMSAALLIASLSFSVRLPRLLPAPLRTPVVYALPTLTVLVTMLYWLWRVRSKRAPRAVAAGAAPGNLATEPV